MNAPDLGVIAPITTGFVVVHLSAIEPSKTNPRKHFDDAAMAELTQSVRDHGVIQPILVRPSPDEKSSGYELVAGERRYRAAKAAGLAEIPAIVRDLTDLQALELQVVENLKRADLHPLEEAEGYERLMDTHGMSADQVADKIGKSKAYVYARLKLMALCAEAREAFFAGKLNPSTALLVARIPGAKIQAKALKEITEPDYRGEPLSVRTAAEHIQRIYMLRLDQAPFSTADTDLIRKAGACTVCPKRAGNQPELFGDIKDADTCTDPTCFAAKKLAHWAKVRDAAIANGILVITGKDAKAIKPNDWGAMTGGYVELSKACPNDEKLRSYEKLVGKSLKPTTYALLEDPKTKEFVKIAKLADLKPLLKEKGIGVATARDRSAEEAGAPADIKQEREKAAAKNRFDDAVRSKLLSAIHGQKNRAITHADLCAIAVELYMAVDEADYLESSWWPHAGGDGLGPMDDDVRKALGKLSIPDLGGFMVDCVAAQAYRPGALAALATRRGVDVDAVRAEVKAELAEADTSAKAETPAKKGKAKKA